MSMVLSIYVGPYLILPAGFDWWPWAEFVTDGRMEAAESDDEPVYLIPNQKLDTIDRQMKFDRHGDWPVVAVCMDEILDEERALERLATPLILHCEREEIELRYGWGVVPCYS